MTEATSPDFGPPLSPDPDGTRRGCLKVDRGVDGCVWLLVGGALFSLLVILFAPVWNGTREKHNRTSCMSNLKQLGLSLILYRDVHGLGRQYPPHDGERRFNHGDSVILLFLDAHVERIPLRDPRLGGLGKGGLLDPLAN